MQSFEFNPNILTFKIFLLYCAYARNNKSYSEKLNKREIGASPCQDAKNKDFVDFLTMKKSINQLETQCMTLK